MIVPRVRRLPRSTNDNFFDATFGFGGLPDIADYPLRLPAGHQSEIGRHFRKQRIETVFAPAS